MRVLTYNIAGARGLGRVEHTDRVAELIRKVSADVVGLQEVVGPEGEEGPAELLARLTGMHVVYGPAHHGKRCTLGNAVLSRQPIVSSGTHGLPGRFPEQRIVLEAETSFDGRPVTVFNTHLVHLAGAASIIRRRQAAEVARRMMLCPHAHVLMGDLNAGPQARELHALRKVAERHLQLHGVRSWPARRPVAHYDHVWPGRGWDVDHVRALERHVSDHRPVLAQLRWRGHH